ncbi:MAG: SURF1 family protein [Gammaproteobacteria bacterium]
MRGELGETCHRLPAAVGGFQFRPSFWPTVVTLPLLALLVSLGFWQISRGHQKQALLHAYAERTKAPPVHLDTELIAGPAAEALRYRPVAVSGRYDSTHQFLLDNRIYRGRVGYQVFTPLRIAGTDTGVLVERGWVPLGESRERLPLVTVPAASRRIQGLVDLPPRIYTLGDQTDTSTAWPKVLQKIQLRLQAQQLGYRLLPVVILLGPGQPDGFVRDWHPLHGFGPERNFGYAFQWFMLAAVLLFIYIKVNTRRIGGGHDSRG